MGENNTPAGEDSGDYLGYGVYAQTLWNRVEAALNKDQGDPDKLGDDPLVVGIFGEWGAGKSKLLKLMLEKAEKLASQNEHARSGKDGGFGDAGFSLTVPVFFQPWKYEHEENLLVPLLLHIVQSLHETIRRGQTPGENLGQKAELVGDKVFAALPQVVEAFKLLHNNVAADLALATDPTGTAALLKTAGWVAKAMQKVGAPRTTLRKDFRVTADGRFYYNFHAALKDVTRPSGNPAVLDGIKLSKGLRINFVIFIDDLDRCLPEKAVETLELIKTVFNLESFAFVLALDEEVVERGIGHRYKDYALVNKKPEMPITGFEYLEKIVHLPFRLPALTDGEALVFLARHEGQLLKEQALRRWPLADQDAGAQKAKADWIQSRNWFSEPRVFIGRGLFAADGRDGRPSEPSGGVMDPIPASQADLHSPEINPSHEVHLAHLVVGCFNAHVPRKLIRVVELFNQVQDVLEAMQPPRFLELGGPYDPRQVLSLLLLQLFQPDLYRSLRRNGDTFELFFAAFRPLSKEEQEAKVRRQLSATTSDADLLHWAINFLDEQPPVSLRAAQQRIPRLVLELRHASQHKRLPLVERLLEHRSIQRHPFDPMRLMQALERSAQPDNIALNFSSNLFALLSRDGPQPRRNAWEVVKPIATSQPASPVDSGAEIQAGNATDPKDALSTAPRPSSGEPKRRHSGSVEVADVNALFLALLAPDEATQKRVAQDAGLELGQALGPRSAQALIAQIEREFQSTEKEHSNAQDLSARRQRLAQGLAYLAPHLVEADALALWNLTGVKKPNWETERPFADIKALKQAAQSADLFTAMGLDDRFDPEFFYLPKENTNKNHGLEPIPGFVWVQKESADFKSKEGSKIHLKPFLMARYLTTVDQFAVFIEGGGYKNPDWWDSQGWSWVTGEWDRHKSTSEWLRKRLGQRPVDERKSPARWPQQRLWGSRPVWGVNWFEARAYANWLNQQDLFRQRLQVAGLDRASVALPIEAQWERAARASGFDLPPDGREYVWNDDKAAVELRANIEQSGLGRASPVGLFAPNPLGICDLNGNLWEWQDNLYKSRGSNPQGMRIRPLVSPVGTAEQQTDWLEMTERVEDSAAPALRGGAWGRSADGARASFRFWVLPDFWNFHVGFRVVLSLAE